MTGLLSSLWPLFALIVGGFVLRRLRFPNDEFWPGAERINYFILFPALLFKSLASAPLRDPALLRVALCVGLVMALAWLGLLLLRRRLQWKAARFGVFVQGSVRFNTYIGLAAVGAVFGSEGLALMALLLAITVPAVNILSVYAFTADGNARLGAAALAILRNPLVLACAAGIAANFAGLGLGGGVDHFLGFLAATSLPLGLLCVGAALQPKALGGETMALAATSAARLLLLPALAWLISALLGLPALESAVLVLFFGLPSAPTAYVLARQLGGDAQLMAGIITLQTLLAALSLPLLLQLVR